jgi:hypothetical protein
VKLQNICESGVALSIEHLLDDSQLTQQMQIRLKALGLLGGRTDGVYGPITEAAWRQFCHAFGFSPQEITPAIAEMLIECRELPGLGMVEPETVASILNCPLDEVQNNLPAVLTALAEQKILDKPTLIAAIATIGIETGGFRPIKEYGGEAYFTQHYEWREDLGNIHAGDGCKYCGRGFIQITGRANYRGYGLRLNIPLEDKPDLALDPVIGAKILALYFNDCGVFLAARDRNWKRVRALVNGGFNGLNEFMNFVERAIAEIGLD